MFRKLIIPLDGSEFSAKALPIGVELAVAANASVHVIGIAETDAELAWTHDHVHDDAKRAGVDVADVEVRVDPDPVQILLELSDDAGSVVCLATHDRMPPAARIMHAVGSRLLERARRPVVVVGPNATTEALGSDVVVAVDGVGDAEPLLAVAAAWALQLHSRVRIATVYEPALADLRRPEHFTRHHGPPGDPEVYLSHMRDRIADVGLDGVDTIAIPDPVSEGAGLEQHLHAVPARILVLGGGHPAKPRLSDGVARHLLANATIPLLIVNRSE